MTTKFIGIKEFRQNISKIANRSRKTKQRFVVLNRNTPVLEVRPVESSSLESLVLDIEMGLQDVKAGRVYSHTEVEKMLGL